MAELAGVKERLLYVAAVMLVAEVPVYWTVEVEAVKTPPVAMTRGVPEPERVRVLVERSSVWLLPEPAPMVKTAPTVVLSKRV